MRYQVATRRGPGAWRLLGIAGTGLLGFIAPAHAAGQEVQAYDHASFEASRVRALAFSPNRPFLAVGHQDGWVRILDVEAGQVRLEQDLDEGPVSTIRFHPDGTSVFVGTEDGSLGRLDLVGGQLAAQGSVDFDVRSLDVGSRGQRVLVGGDGGNVALYSATFERQTSFEAPNLYRRSIHWVALGLGDLEAAAFGDEGAMAFWEIGRTEPIRQLGGGEETSPRFRAVARDNEGRMLALGQRQLTQAILPGRGRTVVEENWVDIFSWERGRPIRRIELEGGEVRALAVSPDRRFVAIGLDNGEVAAYSTAENRRAGVLAEEGEEPRALAWSPDGRWAAAAFDDAVRVWSLSYSSGPAVTPCLVPGDPFCDQDKISVTTENTPIVSAAGPVSMAILGFQGRGVEDELAIAVGELVGTQLANNPTISLAERSRVEEVIDELGLQQDGFTDPANAAQLGRLLNAEKVIFGTVSRFGTTIEINARVVETETGRIEGARGLECRTCAEEDLPGAARFLSRLLVEFEG
ncbi:MAG: hypothetical protein HKO53_20140 [Gemmatimonadetes bacterium]|nr:hypothetical protein [Gemmatimonadota bacterium]